jgi:hypothetical protein
VIRPTVLAYFGAVIAATANNDALPIGKTRAPSRSERTHLEPRANPDFKLLANHKDQSKSKTDGDAGPGGRTTRPV